MPAPLEVLVGDLLKEQHLTLSTAESCTGGLIAFVEVAEQTDSPTRADPRYNTQ